VRGSCQCLWAGAVLVWAALARPSTPDAALTPTPNDQNALSTSPSARKPSPERHTAGADQTNLRDQTKGLVLPESEPVAVSIPRIGVQSRLVELGLNADRAMAVPQDPAVAGWFSRGPAPGALGPVVIAGHVTWNGAYAVFHRLGTMRRGDQVIVTRKDGKAAVFTVTRVARFSKSRFPTRAVYGQIDHAGLRVITCVAHMTLPDTGTWTTSLSSPDLRRYAGLVANEPTSQPSITSQKGF
jgi:sortase (surface protein transpeptidase)